IAFASLAALFLTHPALGLGLAASPLLYAVWGNSRYSLPPVLAPSGGGAAESRSPRRPRVRGKLATAPGRGARPTRCAGSQRSTAAARGQVRRGRDPTPARARPHRAGRRARRGVGW